MVTPDATLYGETTKPRDLVPRGLPDVSSSLTQFHSLNCANVTASSLRHNPLGHVDLIEVNPPTPSLHLFAPVLRLLGYLSTYVAMHHG